MKKADNFDASKWLVENKITTQSRLNEEEYSSERINQRDVEIAGGEVINHTFDTVDMIDLDNGYKVKITTTYYFRDPGVKGYTSTASDENPMLSGVKTTLMDSTGKPIKNHNFTGSGQWWMLQGGKEYFMPQIKAWWENKIGKLGLSESKLNEDLTDEIAALPNHHTAEDTAEATLVVGKYAVVRYDESDEGGENMYVVWDNTVNQDEIGSYDDEPEFESTDPAEVAAFLKKNESLNEEESNDEVLSKEELINRLEQVFGSEDMSHLNFFEKLAINMVKKQIISKIKSGQIQTRAGIKAALSGN
jgi:hypothetical protein